MKFRSTLLLSSTLSNSEAWYGLTKSDIEALEWNDLNLLRKVFEVPSSCPKEMLYLETGCLPVSYLIVIRRLMFLHYILHEEEFSLIYRFLQSQLISPLKGDWILEIKKNLEEYNVGCTIEEIKKVSESSFKKKVEKAVRMKAFKDLIKVKNSHNKVKEIVYKEFKLQEYLKPNSFSNFEAKFAFHARCRMLKVKKNYKQSYKQLFCPICSKNSEDTQQHLLECESLVNPNILTVKVPEYNHLFSDNLDEQVSIVRMLKENFGKRRKLLEEVKEN